MKYISQNIISFSSFMIFLHFCLSFGKPLLITMMEVSMVVLYGSMVIVLFISKVIKFKEKTFVMNPVKIIYSLLDFHLTILNKRC